MDINSNGLEMLKSIQDPHEAAEARRLVHEIDLLFKEISWDLPSYYEEVAKKEIEIDSKNMSRDELTCRLAHSLLVEEADSIAKTALNKTCDALEKIIKLTSVLWKNGDETTRRSTDEYIEIVLKKGFDEGKEYQNRVFGKNYAITNAKRKLAKDPKQVAKKFVFECWQVWQEEPHRYGGKTDFARQMLRLERCKPLESQAVIVKWCGQWEKGTAPS